MLTFVLLGVDGSVRILPAGDSWPFADLFRPRRRAMLVGSWEIKIVLLFHVR